MPIDLKCDCGWNARVKEEYAGKKVKCKECGTALLVAKPPEPDEENAYELLSEAEDPPPSRPKSRPEPERERADEPPVRNLGPAPAPKRTPKPKKIEYRTRDEDDRSSRYSGGIALSPAAAGAIGSIILGGILIALASSNGRVSIYGILLVGFGLVTFVRALMGASEE